MAPRLLQVPAGRRPIRPASTARHTAARASEHYRLWFVISWLPWSADAFARAARDRKPVLLSITAAWCHACHEMDRTTYADPEVAILVRDGFIPIRVDTDRRPDINERYNLGGWPTTAFLTPEGDMITGGTFVPLD